jgi:hypothetical protein
MFTVAGCCGGLKSVLLVLLCPITCPLGYCIRRKPPPKTQPKQEIVVIPAPPQEVIYEKPGPPKIVEYFENAAPAVPRLCPVFVPNSFNSLPNEGIQRLDILQIPDVPVGFQDMRFIDPHALNDNYQGPIAAQLAHVNPMQIQAQNNMHGMQSIQQMQNLQSSVINNIAVGGWMPMGATR